MCEVFLEEAFDPVGYLGGLHFLGLVFVFGEVLARTFGVCRHDRCAFEDVSEM